MQGRAGTLALLTRTGLGDDGSHLAKSLPTDPCASDRYPGEGSTVTRASELFLACDTPDEWCQGLTVQHVGSGGTLRPGGDSSGVCEPLRRHSPTRGG
jgi:hypothetical protein